MKCTHLKENGDTCGAQSMIGSKFCFSHNPDCKDQKLEAVRRGGLHKPDKDERPLAPLPAKSVEDIRNLIEDTVNRIRTEPLTHQKANSIGYLLNITINAIEVAEVEKRLEALEKTHYENT